MFDLTPDDVQAADAYFAFMDLFVLSYYEKTISTNLARDKVVRIMEDFYGARQMLRRSQDVTFVQQFLHIAQRAREAMFSVARVEGEGCYMVVFSECGWPTGSPGLVTMQLYARGASVDEVDEKRRIKNTMNRYNINKRAANDIRNKLKERDTIPSIFATAHSEYMDMWD